MTRARITSLARSGSVSAKANPRGGADPSSSQVPAAAARALCFARSHASHANVATACSLSGTPDHAERFTSRSSIACRDHSRAHCRSSLARGWARRCSSHAHQTNFPRASVLGWRSRSPWPTPQDQGGAPRSSATSSRACSIGPQPKELPPHSPDSLRHHHTSPSSLRRHTTTLRTRSRQRCTSSAHSAACKKAPHQTENTHATGRSTHP